MEYLRSKVAQTDATVEESEEKHDGDDDEDRGPMQLSDSAYESGDRDAASKTKSSVSSKDKKQSKAKRTAKQEVTAGMDSSTLLFNSAQYLYSGFYPHLCVTDGADDRVHSEAERSPVQRERGE